MSAPKIVVELTRDQLELLVESLDAPVKTRDGALSSIEDEGGCDRCRCSCVRQLREFFDECRVPAFGQRMVRDILFEALDRAAMAARKAG